jgi:adenylate kinase family enzyme
MHKIMITVNAGSGKTTLTHKLANILNRHDIICLDKIIWKSGWLLVNKEEKELELAKIAKMESWIVDGVSNTILEAADTILFLDYPRRICYWRAFRRNWKYIFKSRPELPEKCPELMIIGSLIKIIWNFPALAKPDILRHINENLQKKKIFYITNNTDLKVTIDEIKQGETNTLINKS